jgi:hypothetical protein
LTEKSERNIGQLAAGLRDDDYVELTRRQRLRRPCKNYNLMLAHHVSRITDWKEINDKNGRRQRVRITATSSTIQRNRKAAKSLSGNQKRRSFGEKPVSVAAEAN